MHEELFTPIPDPEAYKKRIGLEGVELEADKESLDRIVRSHLHNVAFENLDSWGRGLCPELGIEALFEKIVLRHRGGWCFELNSLFNAFLRSLGFETYMVVSHVMAGSTELRPPAHCSVIVLLDGEKYFCDVGYGSSVPKGAVNMNGKADFGFSIRREGVYTQLFNEAAQRLEIQFKDIPASPVEFVPLNFYISQIPSSPFRNGLHLNLRLPDGSVGLVEGVLKYRSGLEHLERFVSVEELPGVLDKYFRIKCEGVRFRPYGPIDV